MRSLLLSLSLFALPAAAQLPADAVVRVRLLGQTSLSEVSVQAVDGPLEFQADGRTTGALAPGETATLSRVGADVRARSYGADASARQLRLTGHAFRLRAGRTTRQYRGDLMVTVEGSRLQLVNYAPIEPYVASVVASELGYDVLEAAKAQAILARTYAARRFGATASYDVNDDESSQVYRGMGTVTATSERAAYETAGQVLTYRGALAEAVYSSSSGGYTADNDMVWSGAPVPYLRGVPDPFDTASPDHTWRTTASRSAVLRALSSRFGGRVSSVEVTSRSRTGRVRQMRLSGGRSATISGDDFRRSINAALGGRTIRSTMFEIRTEGDRYVFEGGGFGHGVGMSQFGAIGQARAGRDYRQILAYYFQGTDVTGGGSYVAPDPVLVADRSAATDEPTSALRTRYQPATVRRWPTPRTAARAQAEREIAGQPAASEAPATRRRTAW